MRITTLLIILAAGACTAPAAVCAQEAAADSAFAAAFDWAVPGREEAEWNLALTAGFDAFVHTYPLATADTTETIAEYLAQVGVEGRSARRGSHRWNVRAESSVGTELVRERFEARYRLLDSERRTRLHAGASLSGRQYRRETEYFQSSDNLDGRLDLRGEPLAGRAVGLETRAWGAFERYADPSELEIDFREIGGGAALRSHGLGDHVWRAGWLAASRVYPDSSRIDRDTWSLEGEYDHLGSLDSTFRAHHRSDRREIADPAARPSSWSHWTDLEVAVPAGTGRVILELDSERWDYDAERDAWFDAWRVAGFAGFGRGDVLGARWSLGIAGERLAAGDSPESYSQFGLRAGSEAYDRQVSGSISIEIGQRLYDQVPPDDRPELTPAATADTYDLLVEYSDFTYWRIWVMGSWRIHEHLSLDAMANYEPESHTEQEDDSALGFASVRLVWKP